MSPPLPQRKGGGGEAEVARFNRLVGGRDRMAAAPHGLPYSQTAAAASLDFKLIYVGP